MKRKIVIVCLFVSLAGCGQPSISQARRESSERWHKARAHMLLETIDTHLRAGNIALARRKAREAVSLAPEFAEARMMLGKVFIEQGSFAAATDELSEACHLDPKSAESWYLLGVAQEKDEAYIESLISYRKALALETNSVEVITAIAEVLVQMERPKQAAEHLKIYMRLLRNDAGTVGLAARVNTMAGDYDQAAEYYTRATKLDSKNTEYRESLIRVLMLGKRHELAALQFDRLLASEEYKPEAWVYSLRGDCFVGLNKPGLARREYDRALRLDAVSAGLWARLARAQLADKDIASAAQSAGKALVLEPGHAQAAEVLGYALLKQGKAAEAIAPLKTAAGKNAKSVVLHCLLGKCYQATGDKENAGKAYVKATKIDPTDKLAKRLLDIHTKS